MLKVAQVGQNLPPTADDGRRLIKTLETLVELGLDIKGIKSEVINLEYGRDFLREKGEYDVVVLHSLFHVDDLRMKRMRERGLFENEAPTIASPLHTVDTWRKRLTSSKAKLIFVFEDQAAALSGWNLGQLEAYEWMDRGRLIIYRSKEWTEKTSTTSPSTNRTSSSATHP